jgi:hypothetical protein
MSATMTVLTRPRFYRNNRGEIVEAMQYDSAQSCEPLHAWIGQSHSPGECAYAFDHDYGFELARFDGPQRVLPGDYVVRTAMGTLYRCGAGRFELTHEIVSNAFAQADCERVREYIEAAGRLTWGDVSSILEAAVSLGLVPRA